MSFEQGDEGAGSDGASSVSVCGGGEDSSKGDKGGKGVVNATDEEALQCEVSTSSPALSAVSFAVGMIFRRGRADITLTGRLAREGDKKASFI